MPNFLPSGISLKCYKPDNTLRFDYSAQPDLKLTTTDEINCGCATADFELCNYPKILPHFGDTIVVKDESRNLVLWVGEPDVINKDIGVIARIQCLGYGKTSALDLPYVHGNVVIPANPNNVMNPAGSKQVYAAGITYATIVSDTLTRCQNIFQGAFPDLTSITLAEDSRDFIGLAPAQIWNELNTLTASGLSTPLIWYVRGAPAGGPLPSLYMSYADFAPRLMAVWDNKTVKVMNDTYQRESFINGCSIAYGSGLQYNFPDDYPASRDHTIFPTNRDRDKFINANNNIKSTQQAAALGSNYVNRFGPPLRPSRSTVILCGANITAVPPLVDPSNQYPFFLITSGWAINVLGLPGGDEPFNYSIRFIVKSTIDYTKGSATLETGELTNTGTTLAIMETYLTSRPYQATNSGQPSYPYVDQDTTPSIGPPADGANTYSGGQAIQNTESTVIPKAINNSTLGGTDGGSLTDPTKPRVAYDATIDPRIIPDYGIQAQATFSSALGLKQPVQVIPGILGGYNIDFVPPDGSNTVPTDSIIVEIWKDYPPTSKIATIIVSAAQGAHGTFPLVSGHYDPNLIFSQAARVSFIVTSPAGDDTIGVFVSLYGPKVYPDLGVTK